MLRAQPVLPMPISVGRSVLNDARRRQAQAQLAARAIVRNDACLGQAIPQTFFNFSDFTPCSGIVSELSDGSYFASDLQEEVHNMDLLTEPDLGPEGELNAPIDDEKIKVDLFSPDDEFFLLSADSPSVAKVEFLDSGFEACIVEDEKIVDLATFTGPVEDDAKIKFENAINSFANAKDPAVFVELLNMASKSAEGEDVTLVDVADVVFEDSIVEMTEEEFLSSHFAISSQPVVVATADILGQAVIESAIDSPAEEDVKMVHEEPLSIAVDDDSQWRALLAQRTLESIFDTAASTPGSVSSAEFSSTESSLFSPGSSVYGASPVSSVENVEKPKKVKGRQGRKRANITPERRREKKKEQNKEAAHRYRLKKKQLEMQQEQTLAELLAQNKALRKQHKKILAKFNGARWMAKSML